MHGVICCKFFSLSLPWDVLPKEFEEKKNIAFSMQSIENGMSFLFFFFLKQGFKLKISRLITTKIIPPIINTLITACKIAQKFYDFANRGKKVTITLMNWKRITFIKRSFWLIAWHTWGTVNKVSQTQERMVSPVYTDKEKNKGEGWFLSQIRLRHCQTRTDSPVASDHRFISDSWPQSTIHPLNYPDIRSVDTLASVHPRAHVCARILH